MLNRPKHCLGNCFLQKLPNGRRKRILEETLIIFWNACRLDHTEIAGPQKGSQGQMGPYAGKGRDTEEWNGTENHMQKSL